MVDAGRAHRGSLAPSCTVRALSRCAASLAAAVQTAGAIPGASLPHEAAGPVGCYHGGAGLSAPHQMNPASGDLDPVRCASFLRNRRVPHEVFS
jgi:hypothetical protein